MNFVAVAIVSVIVLGHPFNKESSFDWFCIFLYLINRSQITKYHFGLPEGWGIRYTAFPGGRGNFSLFSPGGL